MDDKQKIFGVLIQNCACVKAMKWSRKVALVTGGAGLIGSCLVKKLVERGTSVRVLDNLSAYPFDQQVHFGLNGQDGIEFVKGDIREQKVVQKACRDVDVVFHEAAFADVAATIWNPAEDFATNVCGTFNLLVMARESDVERFIFASSAAVYGDKPWNEDETPPVFSEHDKPAPISTYANSKLWGEYEAKLFYELYGLKTTSLRYFSVYGIPQIPKRGSHSWVVAIFTMKLIKGEPLTVFGDGTQVRDFIYVDDVAEATILAVEKETTIGKTINIGTGIPTTIKRLAEVIRDMNDTKVPLVFKPKPKGDPLGGRADTTLMKKLLDLKPLIKLRSGVQRYYEWITNNRHLIPEWL